jgi:hypothetical protein
MNGVVWEEISRDKSRWDKPNDFKDELSGPKKKKGKDEHVAAAIEGRMDVM